MFDGCSYAIDGTFPMGCSTKRPRSRNAEIDRMVSQVKNIFIVLKVLRSTVRHIVNLFDDGIYTLHIIDNNILSSVNELNIMFKVVTNYSHTMIIVFVDLNVNRKNSC